MVRTAAISTTAWLSSSVHPSNSNSIPKICFWKGNSHSGIPLSHTRYFSFLSTSHPPRYSCFHKGSRRQTQFYVRAASSSASVGSAEYVEEPATKTKFQQSLSLPGCSGSLNLFGTGYREKVFAIIGVKVYAAGLYLNLSLTSELNAWKGKSVDAIQEDSSFFKKIFQSPSEKSLQIILVRDVDGKTFWDALDDAILPRIKAPTALDKTALSTFRSVFQDRPLKKGTLIFLTWLDASKLLVSVSSNGLPSAVDATIESASVTSALFDVFLGDTPVSPSLKASVTEGLSQVLK